MKNELYIALFLLLALPQPTSQACSGGWDWDYSFYNLFNQEANIGEEQKPFLLDPENPLYDNPYRLKDERAAAENLDYWIDYFPEEVKKEDVRVKLYQTPLWQHREILRILRNDLPKKSLDESRRENQLPGKNLGRDVSQQKLQQNTLTDYWYDRNDSISLRYFIFAIKTQSFAHVSSYYRDSDSSEMELALDAALCRFHQLDEGFIKQRYGYQIVKLYHYLDMPEDGIAFFEGNEKHLKYHPQFYYWILEQAAGMYRAVGQGAKASYYYTLVFKNCPARMVQSLFSYKITDEAAWEDVADLCKDKEELAALHTMRALQPWNFALEEMKNIYDLNPESSFLRLLLMRETKHYESQFLEKGIARTLDHSLPRKESQFRHWKPGPLKDFIDFCEKVADEKKRKDSGRWKFAIGYLKFLERDFEGSAQIFAELEGKQNNEQLELDVKLYGFLSEFSAINNISEEQERHFYGRYKTLYATYANADVDRYSFRERMAENLQEYFFDRLGHLYLAQGEFAKSFLCHNEIGHLRNNPDLKIIWSLQDFISKEPETALEAELQSRAPATADDNELLELEGTAYFRKAIEQPDSHLVYLRKSLKTFQDISDGFRRKRAVHPYYSGEVQIPYNERMFTAFVRDIFNNPDSSKGHKMWEEHAWLQKTFSKKELAETVLRMDSLAKPPDENAAEYALMLGNLFYNLTYHGVYRHVLHYEKSPAFRGRLLWPFFETKNHRGSYNLKHYGPNGFLVNVGVAQAYYKQALEKATNRELSALAVFMLAKCDQAKLLNHGSISYNNLHLTATDRPFLAKFHEEYEGTELYQDAYERCSYLRLYAEGN